MDILNNLNQVVVFQIIMIIVLAWVAIAAAQRFLPWLAENFSGKYRLYVLAFVPVFRLFVFFFAGWMIITSIVGPTFKNLIALLGALGLALGFAFKDYAGSLIAGIVTLYEMPYRLGDWITIEGTYGEVKSIGLRAVEIVTPDDTVVVIPHQKLWNKQIFNANDGTRNLQCIVDFYLHPEHDSKRVIQTLFDVGLTNSFLQINKPVNIVVQEKPWGTHYRLKAYPVDPLDQFRFVTDLTVRGKAELMDMGVTFAQSAVMPEGIQSRHR
jgi:small conductance mechanosensitive channel